MQQIPMVDLRSQYHKIKDEIDRDILDVLDSCAFINGPPVKAFAQEFAAYMGVKHVIPCANGTDALQLSLMALGLEPGDEVVVPTFTYVATAEVVALLGLKPVIVDVDPETFNSGVEHIRPFITERTKAIVPVHLFGQGADMAAIMEFAEEHKLAVIEDAAQAIGADYIYADGSRKKLGGIGHIGCTSFFPTKNLGCYGDGGAMMTNDDELAARLKMLSNHGQNKKYYHAMVGVNSRLDSMQAAVLRVKLRHLDDYVRARQTVANHYDAAFADLPGVITPKVSSFSTHSYHQYTLKIEGGRREALRAYLSEQGVPSVVYYPLPLHHQEAFRDYRPDRSLAVSERLCDEVVSLPVHTELETETLERISAAVRGFVHQEQPVG